MKYFVTIFTVSALVGLFAFPVLLAQDKPDRKSVAFKVKDQAKVQLLREMTAAKKSDNMQRYRQLVAQLDAIEGVQKIEQAERDVPLPSTMKHIPMATNAPLWGDDVLIYAGDIGWLGQFNIERAADTAGNIYAALSHPNSPGNGDGVDVYRSTDKGMSWNFVNGIWWPSSQRAVQGCALSVADTAGGKWMINLLIVLLDSMSAPYAAGDLYSCSFFDDGSEWKYRKVLTKDANTAYRSAALTTDGFFYGPASTWFYGAAERVTPSTGISRGIVAFSTNDNGASWRFFDTTVVGTTPYDDRKPRLGFRKCSYDSLYIVVDEYYAPGDRDIYVYINTYDFSDSWGFKSQATTDLDEYDPDIAVSTLSDSVLVSYTCFSGSSDDALYTWSPDAFATRVKDTLSADPTSNEYYTTVSNVPQVGEDAWRVCYRKGPDSVIYSSGGLGKLAHIWTDFVPRKINQYYPSSFVRPLVGAHRSGTSYIGHAIYAGSGPTNLYFDGSDISVDVNREDSPLPVHHALEQNYPNPFNPTTTIRFTIVARQSTTITVFDLLGKEVATLVNEVMQPGTYTVEFDGSRLTSGVYFYRLQAGGFVQTKRFILLK